MSDGIDSFVAAARRFEDWVAFHKHTQQQWSCYACFDCCAIIDGTERRAVIMR